MSLSHTTSVRMAHAVIVKPPPSDPALVLFDGTCSLCNASVLFIIDRDPAKQFRFAALQSDYALDLLASLGAEAPAPGTDSMVLVEDGRVFVRSDAALRIAGRMRSPWHFARAFLVIPRPLRDWVYDVLARNRHRWFGREESCRVPTPELREYFLG